MAILGQMAPKKKRNVSQKKTLVKAKHAFMQ